MKKKGILLALLVLALTLTVAVAVAEECEHWHTHWEYNQTTHWYVCDDCGEIPWASWEHNEYCNQLGVCADCGATNVIIASTYHPTDAYEWHITDTTHELICSSCGHVFVAQQEHFEECDHPGVCAFCKATGVTMEYTTHPGDSLEWHITDTNHEAVCNLCGQIVVPSEPHFTSEGAPAGICSKCGAAYTSSGATSTPAPTDTPTPAPAPTPLPTPASVQLNSISISGTQEVGGSVTASVSATGATYYSYWVYNGQGALVSEAYMTTSSSYSFTPAKPGIYNVFVTVSDGVTIAQENSGWFPVQGDPVVINGFSVSGDKKPGSPLTATVSATGATGFSFWFYNADNTLLDMAYMVTTNSYTFTPPAAGGYNIFVAVTDGVSGDQTNSGWFLVQ